MNDTGQHFKLTGSLAPVVEKYRNDPEYLREYIAIIDGELTILKAKLNAAYEASSIAETARLNAEAEVVRLVSMFHAYGQHRPQCPAANSTTALCDCGFDQYAQSILKDRE
jgi:hypothetical protein